MNDKPFRFKQFSIAQDKACLKVGTDAVLLGARAEVQGARTILDIGTGTGVIAIMLAQKSSAHIDAIEIDGPSCEQARENVLNSPWPERIHIIHQSLQDFSITTDKKYDLIVSNPPYFEEQEGASTDARTIARRTCELTHMHLIDGVNRLLTSEGQFWLILPSQEGIGFKSLAEHQGLYCKHCVHIVTRAGKPEKRVILCLSRLVRETAHEELIIQLDQNHFTPEYIKLTEDFYLGLK